MRWGILTGIVIPAIIVLSIQYFMNFNNVMYVDNRVIFAPFEFFKMHNAYNLLLIPKIVLSFAFPLSLYIVNSKALRTDIYFISSSAMFFISLVPTFLFVESSRPAAGNFTWGSQIALFIWFFSSMVYFTRSYLTRSRKVNLLIIGIYGLHLVSGVIWYFAELLNLIWW